MGKKPRIVIIATGGSVAMPGDDPLDLVEYGDHGRRPEDVEATISRFEKFVPEVELVPMAFRSLGSIAIVPADWLELGKFITQLFTEEPGLAGAVVTHGTATIEETAYFLHLSVRTPQPVVLVGSQRPPNGLSSDASANFRAACLVAADPMCHELGTVVVMNDAIVAARDVRKSANYRLQAFQGSEFGVLGTVEPDGSVHLERKPTRLGGVRSEFDMKLITELPRVDIALSYAGVDATVINAFIAIGTKGIVSAGFGPGRPTPVERKALAQAVRDGVVVVQSSRTLGGSIMPRAEDREVGFISADDLAPQKARILLMLTLATGVELGRIRTVFSSY